MSLSLLRFFGDTRSYTRATLGVFLCCVLGCLVGIPVCAADEESSLKRLEFYPEGNAYWGMRNIFAPVRSIFTGRDYWYAEREIRVETVPPGGVIDLYYVRSGFQKMYEQVESPFVLVLPRRIDLPPRDTISVRAFVEGFHTQELTFNMHDDIDDLTFEMVPLSNTLKSVSHTLLGPRGGLTFFTKEKPTVRIQERADGFSIIFVETAVAKELTESLKDIQSSLIDEISVQQLGVDLMVQVSMSKQHELRSRLVPDIARGGYRFVLDFLPEDGAAEAVDQLLKAIARLSPSDIAGCKTVFDRKMRKALDPQSLARALSPRGEFTDPVLRASMRRLGEISTGGKVTLTDGTKYKTEVPIELEAALTQAAEVKGFIVLLRALTQELDSSPQWKVAYQGLVAPEMSRASFAALLQTAAQAESACR